MTVHELIAHLQTFPGDTRVVVDGYEGGYDDPHAFAAFAVLDANKTASCYGCHDVGDFYIVASARREDVYAQKEVAQTTVVVVVSRNKRASEEFATVEEAMALLRGP